MKKRLRKKRLRQFVRKLARDGSRVRLYYDSKFRPVLLEVFGPLVITQAGGTDG